MSVDALYWPVTWFFNSVIVSKFRFMDFCEYAYVIHCGNNAPYKFKFKLIYDRRSDGQSVLVSGSHLEPMTWFLFSAWQLRVSWCEEPSLARRWACNLLVKVLLGLARAVTLGSKFHRTHDHILLSNLWLPQLGRPGPHIYYIQLGTGWLSYTPDTGFPLVASYTRRAAVEVFKPTYVWLLRNFFLFLLFPNITSMRDCSCRLTVGRKWTSTSTSTSCIKLHIIA
jgi:hypothetical protein